MTAHTTLCKTTGRTLGVGGLSSGLATSTVATTTVATTTVATAAAAPILSDEAGPGTSDTGHLVDVVCFNIPHRWNLALAAREQPTHAR